MSNETFAFRSALGGFHRGDVSKYISETAAAHQAQTERLQEQIASRSGRRTDKGPSTPSGNRRRKGMRLDQSGPRSV